MCRKPRSSPPMRRPSRTQAASRAPKARPIAATSEETAMKPTNRILVAVAAGLFAGGAAATLPPPTAEEKAKTEKKAEETKAENEQAAKALDEAQNRIVRRYRAEHPKAMAP